MSVIESRVRMLGGGLLSLFALVMAQSAQAQYHVTSYRPLSHTATRPGKIVATLADTDVSRPRPPVVIVQETITQPGGAKPVMRFSLVSRPARNFAVTSFRPVGTNERYRVQAHPLFVRLVGTTSAQGIRSVLTGQQVNPVFISPFKVRLGALGTPDIRWQVKGGNVFKDYPWLHQERCRIQRHTDADWQTPSPGFFTGANGTVAVQCTATLDLPPGALVKAPLPRVTITAEPLVSVKPAVTRWEIASGTSQELKNKEGKLIGFGLSGLRDTPERFVGQRWTDVQIAVPPPFSGGLACFAQTLTPNHQAERNVPPGIRAPLIYRKGYNGLLGLDRSFPFWQPSQSLLLQPGSVFAEPDSVWHMPETNKPVGDAPEQSTIVSDVDGGGNDWQRIVVSDTATTWVMYRPPTKDRQPTTFVPLMNYSWRWSGTMTKNVAGQWELTARFPASANQSATIKPKRATDTPPEWDILHSLNPWTLLPPYDGPGK